MGLRYVYQAFRSGWPCTLKRAVVFGGGIWNERIIRSQLDLALSVHVYIYTHYTHNTSFIDIFMGSKGGAGERPPAGD